MRKKVLTIIVIIVILLLVQLYPKLSLKNSNMITFETDNILFNYEQTDQIVIIEISTSIENEAKIINKKLNFDRDTKTNIYIYPNQKVFHRKKYGTFIDLVKIFNKLDWYVGDNVKDNVIVVSPLNPGSEHSKENVIDVIPHEYVHAVIYQINPKTPLWINEGIALYLTNGAAMKGYLHEQVPTYKEIQTSNPIKFANMGGYEFAHTYIEFLENIYGFDKILNYLNENLSYEESFGKSSKELYDEWLIYLEQKY